MVRGRRHRRATILVVSLLVVGPLPAGSAALGLSVPVQEAGSDPAVVGQFTEVFEERGPEPMCEKRADGEIVCKPTAVSSAALNDGRILYWDGIAGAENVHYGLLGEVDAIHNSRSRVLDVSGERARWTVPTPEAGGGGRNVDEDETDPRGTLGAPGRPGDGLTGSTVGQVAPSPAQAPPKDEAENDADLFCSYLVRLADGRIMAFGGTDWYPEPRFNERFGMGDLAGIRNVSLFDPADDRWTTSSPMNHARFYPAGITLADGKVLAVSGTQKVFKNTQLSQVRRSETFDPATMAWTENYTGLASENSLPLFPRMRLMPNGKVYYYGSGETWAPLGQAVDEALWSVMQSYDPATKRWTPEGLNPLGSRNLAIDVMLPLKPPYQEARAVVAGGTAGPFTSQVSTLATQEISVDLDGILKVEMTGLTNNLRWGSQGVLLPDGTVFAVNGSDIDHLVAPGLETAIRQTEIYHPDTRRWVPAATSARDRIYHHSTVLLADGRVLVGGHSPAPTFYGHNRDFRSNNDKDPSFQIYSPPYLFRGPRPEITSVQSGVAWGEPFDVEVSGGEIESVIMVRPIATNHMIDNDQRAVFMDFTQHGDRLTVTAPPHGAVIPPGAYYLFVNRRTDKGPVPSVARLVNVGPEPDTRPAPPAPVLDSTRAVQGMGASPDVDSRFREFGECVWCGRAGTSSAAAALPALARDSHGFASTAASSSGPPRSSLRAGAGRQGWLRRPLRGS